MSSHRRPAALMALACGLTIASPKVNARLGLVGGDAVALVQLVGGLLSIAAGVWFFRRLTSRRTGTVEARDW